jgi:hypothetical protein
MTITETEDGAITIGGEVEHTYKEGGRTKVDAVLYGKRWFNHRIENGQATAELLKVYQSVPRGGDPEAHGLDLTAALAARLGEALKPRKRGLDI